MKKILIAVIVIVIIGGFVYLNIKKRGGEGGGKTVFYGVLKRGAIVTKVSAEGEIRAATQVDISSDVMGRIEKFYVDVGDSVRIGQKLVKIESKSYEAKVNRQRAILESDLARLTNLQQSYDRAQKLYKKGMFAESNLLEIQSNLNSLKAQLKADSFLLDQYLEDLKKTLIRSPINGVVLSRDKEEGEMVIVGTINNPGTKIMTLANLDSVLVKAEVDESEIVLVKEGDSVDIKVDAMPDSVFHGIVTVIAGYPKVSGSGSETTVSYPVDIAVTGGSHGLLPGMSASCDIIVGVKENVLKLPMAALGTRIIKGKRRDVVFVYKNGTAHLRPVKLGISGENFVEVVKGLSEGDTVLVGPFKVLKNLHDGERVKIVSRKEFFRFKRKK